MVVVAMVQLVGGDFHVGYAEALPEQELLAQGSWDSVVVECLLAVRKRDERCVLATHDPNELDERITLEYSPEKGYFMLHLEEPNRVEVMKLAENGTTTAFEAVLSTLGGNDASSAGRGVYDAAVENGPVHCVAL